MTGSLKAERDAFLFVNTFLIIFKMKSGNLEYIFQGTKLIKLYIFYFVLHKICYFIYVYYYFMHMREIRNKFECIYLHTVVLIDYFKNKTYSLIYAK